jgi:hypothetical protein
MLKRVALSDSPTRCGSCAIESDLYAGIGQIYLYSMCIQSVFPDLARIQFAGCTAAPEARVVNYQHNVGHCLLGRGSGLCLQRLSVERDA